MTKPLRALVTNDDGISSEGIRQLALAAVDAGLEVVIAAPLRDSSGSSSSLTAVESDGHIVVEQRRLAGLDGVRTYGVAAVPAFISLIAARGAFGPAPDVVLSGINKGVNTGHAILHSGTVGATLTGSNHGCRGLAVSIEAGEDICWETGFEVACQALSWVLATDESVVLNVNVPNVRPDAVKGVRRAGLARFGAVQTNIAEVGEGYVRVCVADIDAEFEPGTDAALVNSGYVTVTALQSICEAPDVALPVARG